MAAVVVLPSPGLILGIAAIALRRSRFPLAVLAVIATFGGVLAIIGTLVGSLAPMYQVTPLAR